ncbi:Hypothetical predicted protein [Drosophila guanche]|uniref:Uncharacterized protein n=1 Tax=Drosophila guanche TaxID=7266 RepID=A0A3B0JGS6_DROGU|nr:Hypothetical predicted protein [Drosophila guanche]
MRPPGLSIHLATSKHPSIPSTTNTEIDTDTDMKPGGGWVVPCNCSFHIHQIQRQRQRHLCSSPFVVEFKYVD